MRAKATVFDRKRLPSVFTYSGARAAGLSAERLYAYRDQGLVEQIGRGLYRWADAPEIDGIVKIPKGGKLRPGDWADVEIVSADAYDLKGRLLAAAA